jgi:hypothetical protein
MDIYILLLSPFDSVTNFGVFLGPRIKSIVGRGDGQV